jgi:hypothetical protein
MYFLGKRRTESAKDKDFRVVAMVVNQQLNGIANIVFGEKIIGNMMKWLYI